ncbi:MAG TPA: FAD:protein FMN transferase [Candidatus Dormibacteraeota bacterium]|jgi:thiamine biosynthesis lipoprotein|nr:FAD:protein FMN transferase [Candidatus Dormibacteraeota bacterium]
MSPLAWVDDRALGTGVRVVVTRPDRLGAAKSAVDTVLRDIDMACSRFRDDSELSRLNARPGVETQVSELLARALEEGLRGARLTGGDVDPTVGTAMRLAGYDVDFASVAPDAGPLVLTAAAVPGWQTVRFNRVTRSVVFPAGVEIDLGATAKALAADMAARAGLDVLGEGAGILVSLGGDIALAGVAPEGGWIVQVSDDSNDPIDAAAESIALHGGGIASSSTRVRRWRRGGVELHHIIDPRTGLPAQTPWRLASVVADTCVDANIASTAAIVRGVAAVEWLEGLGLPARLVSGDGEVVRTVPWPSPPQAL